MPDALDAIVIGSGPNGLAAALVLARAGRRVHVLEAANEIGGGTRTAELTLPGFHHDVCSAIHPLTMASPFLQTLPLGEHGLAWIDPPVAVAHPLDDGSSAALHRSIDATAESFDHARDAASYRKHMTPLLARAQGLLHDVLGPPLQFPANPVAMTRFGWWAARSAKSVAEHWFQGSRARGLFAGLAGHAVLPLERSPSAAVGLLLTLSGHVANWPFARGGAHRITQAMAALLRAWGGTIATDHRVMSMQDLPPARVYLFDLTPRQVLAIAGDALPSRYRAALERYRYGPGVFKLDWALSDPIPWKNATCRQAGTVHLGGTFHEVAEAERDMWQGRHPQRPFVLLAQQSLFDDTRAPAGRHTGWAYCHVPAGSTRDMTDAIEQQVERFAPGFRDTILARHAMTAVDMERYNPNYIGGDIGAGSFTWRQIVGRPVLRRSPYTTPNPRIMLCSASTPPGGGVHGMCGYHAATAALRGVLR